MSRERWRLLHGDCRVALGDLDDASVDAVVTDPPYELGFMGKTWDASGVAYDVNLWAEVLRVLKPGGHLLAFGGTRTYHRMTCAIEDAGFEIRDSIHWLYGSGFPKSLDVSKAIDKAAGAEREVIGTKLGMPGYSMTDGEAGGVAMKGNIDGSLRNGAAECEITAPATPEAAEWEGWGTALKPAHEPIVVARKPLAGTVAANVLAHGTGALNIDGCRVGTDGGTARGKGGGHLSAQGAFTTGHQVVGVDAGRWPANVVLDSDAATELDRQSGESVSPSKVTRDASRTGNSELHALKRQDDVPCYGDAGGASRFFYRADLTDDDLTSFRYVPKPDRAERDAGLDDVSARFLSQPIANNHPTVKPLDLMRWLVRLVTPPGGTILDPFAGSGTTIAAALLEGFDVVGIELTDAYLPTIERRARWAEQEARFGPVTGPTVIRKTMPGEVSLFDDVEGTT